MIWIIYYCLGPSQDQLFRGGLLSNIFTIIVTFPLRALIIIIISSYQKCHNWALARAWEGGFIYLSNSIERINSREILQVGIIHDVITHPIIGVITATVIIINVTQKVLGTDDLDDLWAEYCPGPPPEQLCRGGSMHRIFRVKNSRIDESIIRSKYWDAEVPQAFHSMLEKKDGLDFIKPQRSN